MLHCCITVQIDFTPVSVVTHTHASFQENIGGPKVVWSHRNLHKVTHCKVSFATQKRCLFGFSNTVFSSDKKMQTIETSPTSLKW